MLKRMTGRERLGEKSGEKKPGKERSKAFSCNSYIQTPLLLNEAFLFSNR